MAQATNTSVVLSNTAPSQANGLDCTWLSEWSAANGGTMYDRFPLSNDPSPLLTGDRYRISAGAIVKTEPGFKRGATAPASPIRGQVFQYSGNAGRLSNHFLENGTTATSTASANDIFIWNGSRWIKAPANMAISYQTEAQAVRALTARITGGLWYQCHTSDPGVNGTANILTGINRLSIPQAQWSVSSS